MDNYLINSKIDLSDRVLKNPIFTNKSDNTLKLSDYVIIYNDGHDWKIIPYNIILQYPVIHDNNFSDNNDDSNKKLCIVSCPYTLFSAIYFGQYSPNNKIYHNNIVLSDDNKKGRYLIPILNNLYNITDDKPIDKIVQRKETKIMTFRNAMTYYPDFLYLDTNNVKKLKPIVPENYFNKDELTYDIPKITNKFKNKQIIYIIEYKSTNSNEIFKKTVIVPRKNNLDWKDNGFGEYYEQMMEEIRDRGGIIYNCFWFAWNSTYPESKVIKL